jgi:membrane AbrB-like protein
MKEKVIIAVALVAGGWLGNRFKLPSGWLTGAMIAGLVAKALVSSNLPSGNLLSIVSQLLIAWLIISTSDVATIKGHPEVLPLALDFVVVLIAFCFAAAWALRRWFGIDLNTAIYATAPGGLSGLAVQATESGAETPVSVAFHLVRITVVLITTPLLAAFATR